MAADLQARDCQVGLVPAWHGETIVVPQITLENSRQNYGLEKQELYLKDGTSSGHYITVAKDDGLPIGGPISSRYTVIEFEQLWKAVHNALKGIDFSIESVGTVSNRSKQFISVKIAERFLAAGRLHDPMLNILNGIGGTIPLNARTSLITVVCANTFAAAMSHKGDLAFNCKHLGEAEPKLDTMEKVIEAHYQAVDEFQRSLNVLHAGTLSQEEAKKFFAGFLVEDDPREDTKISTRTRNKIDRLQTLFISGKGNAGRTLADVFNAITDYESHESSGGEKKPWQQTERSEFGEGAKRKQEGYTVLLGGKVPRIGSMEDVIKRGELVLQAV